MVAIGSVALAEEKDDRSPAQKKLESRFKKEEIAQLRAKAEKDFWDHFNGKIRVTRADGTIRTNHACEDPCTKSLLEFRDGYKVYLKALDKIPDKWIDGWLTYRQLDDRDARNVLLVNSLTAHRLMIALLVLPFDKEIPDKLLPRYASMSTHLQSGEEMKRVCDFLSKRGKRAKDALPALRASLKHHHRIGNEPYCQELEKVIKRIQDASR
jgi:hypothetical protein